MASPDSRPKPVLPRPAPLLGSTTVTSALVGAACLVGLLDAWTSWYRHGVVAEYVAGTPGIWVADLTSAGSSARTVDVVYLLAMAAAGITLLVWLARVRANARLLGHPAPLRRTLAVRAWFAVCLFAAATTFLFYPDPSVAELSVVATVDSVSAVIQCVAGTAVVLVVRQVARRG